VAPISEYGWCPSPIAPTFLKQADRLFALISEHWVKHWIVRLSVLLHSGTVQHPSIWHFAHREYLWNNCDCLLKGTWMRCVFLEVTGGFSQGYIQACRNWSSLLCCQFCLHEGSGCGSFVSHDTLLLLKLKQRI
jgi:hypothetical protein